MTISIIYDLYVGPYRAVIREMDRDNAIIRKKRGKERPKYIDPHRVRNASYRSHKR